MITPIVYSEGEGRGPAMPLLIGLAVYLLWNVFVFCLYAADKRRARRNAWRVRERTLILCAFCQGAVGALAGVYLLRHKTQHLKFTVLIPLALIVNLAILIGLFCLYAAVAGHM